MAGRRKKTAEEVGANMDSLMDALTNVVAVLIFVLLLVNCDVSQKVVKMMEDIIPVSDEDLLKVKDLLKNIEIDEKKLEELKRKTPPSQLDIDEMQRTVQSLQEQIKNRKSEMESNNQAVSELQKFHDQVLQERDAEKKKTESLMAEIQRLQILLDTTPVPNDIPPTEITIPATRPIPEDAHIYYASVDRDRVHLFDYDRAVEAVLKQIESNKSNLMADIQEENKEEDKDENKKAPRSKDKDKSKEKPIIYDQEKMEKFLSKLDINLPPGQKMRFTITPWSKDINFAIILDFNNGGTTLEELKKPVNSFASALNKVRPPKEVVMFRVAENSMLTYAMARDIVENKKIPCGWLVTGGAHTFGKHLPGIVTKTTATPPPRNPNAKPEEKARSTGMKLD